MYFLMEKVFDVPVKNKEETYEKIIEMTENIWKFLRHYKQIAIDLGKQIELENPDLKQQFNFIGKLEEDEATMFFIIAKSEETTFAF